jgi:hypothetical protein
LFKMVTQQETLERLNKEKDYEDELVDKLDGYFLDTLDRIRGLTNSEKERITEFLAIIISDSRKHSIMFYQLITMVIESDSDTY